MAKKVRRPPRKFLKKWENASEASKYAGCSDFGKIEVDGLLGQKMVDFQENGVYDMRNS